MKPKVVINDLEWQKQMLQNPKVQEALEETANVIALKANQMSNGVIKAEAVSDPTKIRSRWKVLSKNPQGRYIEKKYGFMQRASRGMGGKTR